MTVTRPNFNVRTQQVIYREGTVDPFVGFEHLLDQPDGWRYDIKRWCSTFDLRLPTMPRLADANTQGISESEYFLSGVGDKDVGDLYMTDILERFNQYERLWLPSVYHGHYFRYKTPFFYYSDLSRVQYLDTAENRNGRNYIILDTEPDMQSPITAATYSRNPITRSVNYRIKVQQQYAFTGNYSDGEELETVSNVGKITWDNVDYNHKEFIVDNTIEDKTSLWFNKDYTEVHGVVPVTFQDLAACEVLGMSNGSSYQVYYLPHFPVLADDSFHLYVVNGFVWEEWTRVDTWFSLINVSGDYGEKRYFLDKDLGIIYFGSYTENSNPDIGSYVVASYTTTLRIEYEQSNESKMITAWDADVNPVSQFINQGFVCITHEPLEAASIVLTIDKQPMPFTTSPRLYGPIYVGSDYAVLKATVTNISDLVVPGVEVGFTMSPKDVGYLDGADESISVTNGRGEAFTSYQPPTSADSMGYYITNNGIHSDKVRASTHPSYVGYKDVIVNSNNVGYLGKEDEIYIYQVLKDDILLGYDSVEDFVYQLDTPPWVVDATTYSQWLAETIIEYDLKDWVSDPSDGAFAGRKVVVYKVITDNYDPTAINPITGDSGAIVPVRPELVEIIDDVTDPYNGYTRLIYPAAAIPDPSPTDTTNNVGAYWVVANKLVTKVSLPQYLFGEYVTDTLKKIPFGWKLLSENDNVAAGLDGATFITVNPHSGPYQIIDLVGGTTPTDWADAPFRSLSFQFTPPETP